MNDKLEAQRNLTERLRVASELYYVDGKESEFNDTEFDLKMHELEEMERESGVILPNSPTQFVGSDIQKGFNKGEHPQPMLTIDNVYEENELEEWVKKASDKYGVKLFDAEIKYDGVSLELQYENGVFKRALTRGDKILGDDVTANVKGVKDIPFTIKHSISHPSSIDYCNTLLKGNFYVRGEVLMPKSKLAELNQSQIANGDAPFSNTRNACSGSLKQLDPKITATRGLIFRSWDCFGDHMGLRDMGSKHYFLKDLGFKYDYRPLLLEFPCKEDKSFAERINRFKQELDSMNLDYDYDGVVIKFDWVSDQEKVGTQDTKAIGWGIARKWNENYQTETVLNDVKWQVGRTGVLTPVAVLEPVECAGVIVTNSTLNNMDFIRKLNLGIGDTVVLTRSGGVIPEIVMAKHDLLMEMNGANAITKIKAPEVCPLCGAPVIEDGSYLRCSNEHCPEKEKGKIEYFCSKDCCNIMSVGESVVNDLYENRIVRNILDIIEFGAHKETFIEYAVKNLKEGYGQKKISKIADEMERARKETPFEKVLSALSIPGVGKVNGRILAEHFGNIDNLKNATVEELAAIDGIGTVMSADIHKWMNSMWGATIIEALKAMYWQTEYKGKAKADATGLPLSGLTVCFTGKSERFNGDDVEAFLEENGAKCTHSVSKKLDYLIVGDKPGGSKITKAQEFGVELIEEDLFYQKFEL